MERILFCCIGAGLAVGGAYFLYKKWQKYQHRCQEKSNEPTLENSEHFIPIFDVGITKRSRLSVCAKETNRNASDEDETAAILQKTESLKTENSSAMEDITGHDVKSDQDLPLRADGAYKNTSNISNGNLSNFGPNLLKRYLRETDIDVDAFYGEMNEYFTSLSKEDRVSHPDGEQTTVEQGQSFEAGPSSYSSSPSTSGFQPYGEETKRASKKLANRRHSTRKHKED